MPFRFFVYYAHGLADIQTFVRGLRRFLLSVNLSIDSCMEHSCLDSISSFDSSSAIRTSVRAMV